jgi:predicted nuclease with TOPRIM domain
MGTEDKEDDILVKESDDDIVLDEEAIAALVEELVVDISPQKSGWAGTPESQMKHYEEMELARLAGEEARAQQEELQKAVEDLKERNERLGESNKALKETVAKLKNAFDEMSTSNAKLLYTNRILSSPSLNERQKESIVEAISKAGSVNEAKVIYETLQSTGGTPSKKAMPKSLSEAIKRSSTTILPRRQPEQTADTAIDRLQILAGIKNK